MMYASVAQEYCQHFIIFSFVFQMDSFKDDGIPKIEMSFSLHIILKHILIYIHNISATVFFFLPRGTHEFCVKKVET